MACTYFCRTIVATKRTQTCVFIRTAARACRQHAVHVAARCIRRDDGSARDRYSSLICASQDGHLGIVEALLAHEGVDLNAKNRNG